MDEYCIVKQRAGPLVKVFSTDRACFLRKNGECIRSRCGPAMSRTTVDKLELRLALFEYDGVFHSLTFAPENLPESRKDVQQIWNTYLKRLKRWGSGNPFDYVYRIEGLHDSLHIHVFLRNSEYPAVLVRRLWDWGEAYDVPYTKKKILQEDGYRRLARYFTKERPEVGQHPWGPSRTLKPKVPLPEVKTSKTGRIYIPRDAVILPLEYNETKSDWGVYSYSKYLSY